MAELIENPKRKENYLEKLSTRRKERMYVGFDVESSQRELPDGDIVHDFELCCAELFVLNSAGKYQSLQKRDFWKLSDFHQWIKDLFSEYKTLYFVAHNVTFDAVVGRLFDVVTDMDMTCEVFNPRRASYFCRWKSNDANLVLIDSLNFLSGSLKRIGESVGLEKLEMPAQPIEGDVWLAYCRRDVDVMVLGMRTLSKFLSRWNIGQLDITRASIAFKIYRRYYLTSNMLKSVDLDILKREFRSYHGGRVECFRIGHLPKQDYYLLDFNSLYPYVMKSGVFSIKVRYKTDGDCLSTLKQLSKNHGICANCLIETESPSMPYRKGKKIIFPVGRFWSTLSTPEILYALQNDMIKKVDGMVAYYQRPIFANYVRDMHRIKTKYKKDGNEVFAFMTKILLNSLYGKFAQKISYLQDTGMIDGYAYGVHDKLDLKAHKIRYYKTINYKIYEEFRNMVGYNSFPQIASEVASYGRVLLWQTIEAAGREHVYYCDTDSVLVDSEGLRRLRPKIKKDTLGYLQLEKSGNEVWLRGAKDYTFEGQTKVKGIPTKARQIADNIYEYDYWFSTTESLRDTENIVMKVKTMRKHMNRRYDKGIVGKDGVVKPKRIVESELADFAARVAENKANDP